MVFSCGHVVCDKCLSSIHPFRCPMCRGSPLVTMRCFVLDSLVEKAVRNAHQARPFFPPPQIPIPVAEFHRPERTGTNYLALYFQRLAVLVLFAAVYRYLQLGPLIFVVVIYSVEIFGWRNGWQEGICTTFALATAIVLGSLSMRHPT
jgi:hypothetical protein